MNFDLAAILNAIGWGWTVLVLGLIVAYAVQSRRMRPEQRVLFSAKQLAGFSVRNRDRLDPWTLAALTTAALVIWAVVLTNLEGLAPLIFVGLTVGLVYLLLEESRSRT